MNEQESTGKIEQKKLTIEPNQNTLERKGIIFMAGEGNGGEADNPNEQGAPVPPEQEQQRQSPNESTTPKDGDSGGNQREESSENSEEQEDDYSTAQGQAEARKKLYAAVLTAPEVKAQLMSNLPEFSSAEELRKFIDSLNPADERMVEFADYASNPKTQLIDPETKQPIVVTQEARELLFEWMLEKIIGLPDKGSQEARYEVGSFRTQENLTALKALSVSNFEKSDGSHPFAKYIGELIEMRSVAHELRRSLGLGESYKNIIQEHLKSHGLDFLRNELSGVGDVVSQYEISAGLKVSERHKWFDESDIRAIDAEVRNTIVEAGKEGLIVDNKRKLMPWEIDRALNIGKTLFAGTQRYAMYATLGNLPPETAARIGSLPYEYITRTIAPFKVIAARFFGGGGAPRKLMERFLADKRKKDENGDDMPINPLFGIDEDAWITNGIGAPDPESHSWRSQLMFYGDIGINTGTLQEPKDITLLQYIDNRWKQVLKDPKYDGKITTSELFGYDVPHSLEAGVNADICSDPDFVKAIVGQRLYLSSLLRNDHLTPEIKQALVRKIAILDPLKMTALAPDMLDEEKGGLSQDEQRTWKGMRQTLLLGEIRRLQADGASYRDSASLKYQAIDKLREEAERYIRFEGTGKDRKLVPSELTQDQAYDLVKGYYVFRTKKERDLLKKVIGLGMEEARAARVAGADMPFTFMINDAPHVAWAKTGNGEAGLGDENVFRLLLSDQNTLNEGYGALSSIMESPNRDFAKNIGTFVEKVGTVRGRGSAQKEALPIITAWTKMVSTFESSKFIGGFQRMLQIPTSEMEKFHPKSGISLDEKQREVALDGFAQQGSISGEDIPDMVIDGVIIPGEQSGLKKIKKETHSDRRDAMARDIRIILLLLGPVLGGELIKILFPTELLKK